MQDWTLVHFKNSAELALLSPKVGSAVDGDTRSVVLALVLIILACTVILVGAYSAELIGRVPLR